MRSPSAPDALLELFVRNCARSCQLLNTSMTNRLACTDKCKLPSNSDQKQQGHEDECVEFGDSDDDIDEQFDVRPLCLIIMFKHSYHTCMLQTCGNLKPQEDDSSEVGDIDVCE